MRLAFMGSPDFAVPTLKALLQAGHDIAAVYTQPPARAGRGKKERISAVHAAANEAGLPVFTPMNFKDEIERSSFKALKLDAAVVVAYGQILPQAMLDAPKFGCVNIHASLLPRWRGAAPIHRAIMAGDTKTGISIMLMEAGLDTGPVLREEAIAIKVTDTTQDLHDNLAQLGADLIGSTLQAYVSGQIQPKPQAENGICYASKIDKAEAQINWQKPAVEIDRLVRGLFPFPGAWCLAEGERVKILGGKIEAQKAHDDFSAVGTVQPGDGFIVATGDGLYQVEIMQRAGRARMKVADALRGFGLASGTILR